MNATLNKQNKRNQYYVALWLVHICFFFFCIDYMKLFIYVQSAYIINRNKIQIECEKNISLCLFIKSLYDTTYI